MTTDTLAHQGEKTWFQLSSGRVHSHTGSLSLSALSLNYYANTRVAACDKPERAIRWKMTGKAIASARIIKSISIPAKARLNLLRIRSWSLRAFREARERALMQGA
jgi:hypothetical protein